ncbi:unnamed protein product, partial [Mesorhabditis belari]|uniref:Uncharacterized protein n=1 Tax=Mesorhabditis belari TaxID=2138241 RepID=A0AAF3FLT9_9BILA
MRLILCLMLSMALLAVTMGSHFGKREVHAEENDEMHQRVKNHIVSHQCHRKYHYEKHLCCQQFPNDYHCL